jgi:hypothetical protein
MTQTGGQLNVQSFDSSLDGQTYAIEVQNTITLASNGPSGATTFTPTSSDKI